MFKLTRNNAGDARDVAALRAAVFDELTGLWNKSASEVAEDSLKLGGKDAALYALLTDIDGTGNVTSAETSATDGEIVVMSGTSGKGVRKSGTLISTITAAISTLQGYFTNGAAGNAMQAERMAVRTLVNIENTVNQIMIWEANPAREYIVDPTCHNMPYDGYWHVERIGGIITVTAGFCKLIASAWRLNPLNQNLSSLEQWEISIDNGAFSGWKQLTDASGNAVNANCLIDGQSSRSIKVKSGNVDVYGGVGGVTFASAFPNRLLGAIYHPAAGGVCLMATGTASGISMPTATYGSYDWIAWGY